MKRSIAIKVFAALANPNRLPIVEHLLKAPHSVNELANKLPISRPAVSRHLRVLKESKIVLDEARGTRRVYRLRPESLAVARDYFERLWDEARRRFVLASENTRPRRK